MDANFCTVYCLIFGLPCDDQGYDRGCEAEMKGNPALAHMLETGQKMAQKPKITPEQFAALLQLIQLIASLLGK